MCFVCQFQFPGNKKFKKIEFILKTAKGLTAFLLNPDANLEIIITEAFASENFIYQTCFEAIKAIGTLICGWIFSCGHGRINFPNSVKINFFAIL